MHLSAYCPCGFTNDIQKPFRSHAYYHFQWSHGLRIPSAIIQQSHPDSAERYAQNVTELSEDIRLWQITGQEGHLLNQLAAQMNRFQPRELPHYDPITPWRSYHRFRQFYCALEFSNALDGAYWIAFLIGQIAESTTPKTFMVYYLWTAHAWRRKGYATLLLEEVIRSILPSNQSTMPLSWLTPLSPEGAAFAMKISQVDRYEFLSRIGESE